MSSVHEKQRGDDGKSVPGGGREAVTSVILPKENILWFPACLEELLFTWLSEVGKGRKRNKELLFI